VLRGQGDVRQGPHRLVLVPLGMLPRGRPAGGHAGHRLDALPARRGRAARVRRRRRDGRRPAPRGGRLGAARPGRPRAGRGVLRQPPGARRPVAPDGGDTMTAPAFHPLTPGAVLPGDWFPGRIPANVLAGEGTVIDSSFGFKHYYATAPVGLRVG